jgi:hypothetical protein
MRDDGGGGTPIPEKDQNWTNTYKPVEVETLDLRKFFTEMTMKLGPQAMSSTSGVLAPMGEMIGGALLGMGGKVDLSAGLFPEGIVIADLMTNTHAKFAAFFKDVGAGIQCIGDAAAVVAEIYHNGDAENSANINDVLFAFNDPLANRPKDLPKDATTDSFQQQQAAAVANSGQNAMALTAPDSAAKVIYPVNGVTIYLFPDGSTKQVTTSSDSNSWAAGTTTTTEYYFNGKQVGTTTQSQYTVRGGYQTMTTSTSPTSDPKAVGSSTTEVVTNPDGSQDVTTTTVIDAKGTTSTHTVHVAPPPSKDTGGQGPIQTAENQYNSHGDKDYVQKYGAGY